MRELLEVCDLTEIVFFLYQNKKVKLTIFLYFNCLSCYHYPSSIIEQESVLLIELLLNTELFGNHALC